MEMLPGHVQVSCECGQVGGMCETEAEAIRSFNRYSDMAHYVDEWNRINPVGTIVTYFPTYKDADAFTGEVNQPARLLVNTLPVVTMRGFEYGVVTLKRVHRGRYLEIDEEVRAAYGNPEPGTREAIKRARKNARARKRGNQVDEPDEESIF